MEYIESAPCVLCGYEKNQPFSSEPISFTGKAYALGVNKCRMCDLVYISPRLSAVGLAELYNERYEDLVGLYCTPFDPAAQEYRKLYGYVREFLPDGGKILDIGCGTGNFLSQFIGDKRYTIEGVELSRYAGQLAEQKGIRVHFGDIAELRLPGEGFDLVNLMYVLEHVPGPLQVLQEIYRLLKPGGYCLIAVPNYNYLRFVYTGLIPLLLFRKKTHLHPGEHMQNFTPNTLAKMVQKTGFAVVRWECATPFQVGSAPVRMMKMVLSNLARALFLFGIHIGGIHLIMRKT